MKKWYLLASAAFLIVQTGCVSSKKLKETQATADQRYEELNKSYLMSMDRVSQLKAQLENCKKESEELAQKKNALTNEMSLLNNQLDFLKQNNNVVVNQLKDLSVISSAQAESIKKSMENIGMKDAYIQGLQSSIARKDSLNMALVMNLKGAIGNLDDKDINIKVDKGVVYVDISDKLLFRSGSYEITERAKVVLGKVAKVLNNQPDIEFMVEGHTDPVAFKSGALQDNWDLSVKRATTVVRLLQKNYGLDPKRMAAAGRGEYLPVGDNATAEGRAANRRTRIVILPQLDQFFKLLETK